MACTRMLAFIATATIWSALFMTTRTLVRFSHQYRQDPAMAEACHALFFMSLCSVFVGAVSAGLGFRAIVRGVLTATNR